MPANRHTAVRAVIVAAKRAHPRESYDVALGLFFGYPVCCVASYAAGIRPKRGPWLGTGYLPCVDCANKPVIDLLAEIANRRDPRLQPFPKGTWRSDAR